MALGQGAPGQGVEAGGRNVELVVSGCWLHGSGSASKNIKIVQTNDNLLNSKSTGNYR